MLQALRDRRQNENQQQGPGDLEWPYGNRQVQGWTKLGSLRPKGWEQTPKGAELMQAILEAYRSVHGRGSSEGRMR